MDSHLALHLKTDKTGLMKKIIFSILTLLLISVAASAQQNLRTAYFNDGYTFKYKMNPAMAPERGFFAFPALGNLGLGVESNLGLSTFLYPTSDGLTTFLNSSVNSDDFMKKLNKTNQMNLNVNASILAFGFRTGKAFHTVDLSLRADARAALPKSLFGFIKEGRSKGANSWDIAGAGVRADARLELAYGYSRPILDWINVGGRVKLLMGAARANVMIDKMNLTMSGEQWAIQSHGDAMISFPMTIGTQPGSNLVDFEEIIMPENIQEFLTPNIGFAVDLGATADFLDFLTASLSVTDLGFISWNNTTMMQAPEGKVTFDGFGTISTDPDSNNTIGDQFENLGEELLDMFTLEKVDDKLKKSSALAATIHAGIEARMPFYDRLTFGLLATHRVDGKYSWTEGRLSANIAPVNWLSASVSAAISDFGTSAGGVLNLHAPGFCFYVGVDSFTSLINVTPQFIPINRLNTNVSFGISFSFGKGVGRYYN